jgi:thiosulfate/3-mercaptopyruvate sulfurtransferase
MARGKASALVDPAWLHRHRADPSVRLIEVAGLTEAERQAYHAGHIPGALGWKWQEQLWDPLRRDFPAPGDFARRCGAAGIGNGTTVVFYGEGVQFGFYAWFVFRYCGHARVKVLDGARRRWLAEGRPLTTEEPPAPPAVEYRPGRRVERMRVLRDKVLARLGREDTLILDARSPEEYRGERVGAPGSPDVGAMRCGRIPGARHLYFEELLDANWAFRPAPELERLFAARGAGRDRDVLAYCRLSHRATVLYFALTQLLGYRKVRVYDGSWTEWGNLVGVPVER